MSGTGLLFHFEVGRPVGQGRHQFNIGVESMAVRNSRRYLQHCVGLDWRYFLIHAGFEGTLKADFFSEVAAQFVRRHARLIPLDERDDIDLFPQLANGLSDVSRMIPLAFIADWLEVADQCYRRRFEQGPLVFTPPLAVEHQAFGMVDYLVAIAGGVGQQAAAEMQDWFEARRRVQTDVEQMVSTMNRVSGSLDVVDQQQEVLDDLGRRMETVHHEHRTFAARYSEEQQAARDVAAMEARRSGEAAATRKYTELAQAHETLQMQLSCMRQWIAAQQNKGDDDDDGAVTPDMISELHDAEHALNVQSFGQLFEELPLAPTATRESAIHTMEWMHAGARMRMFSQAAEFVGSQPLVDDFRAAFEQSATDVRGAIADMTFATQTDRAAEAYAKETCAYAKPQIYAEEQEE